MSKQKILYAVGVVALVYGAYRGVSCVSRGDEDAVREVIDELTAAFKDGATGRILELLTDDFAVTYRRERVNRQELADYLRYTFFGQQERIELRGGINTIEIEGDSASVVWEGRAVKRSVRRQGGGAEMHRGTANLSLRKVNGAWLLAEAEAVAARDR